VEFGEVEVEAVDLARRRLTVRHHRSVVRQRVHYDRLVIALGASPNTAATPGASEHALTFKSAGDAIRIRNHLIDLFEAAALTEDPWTRRRLLTFVVVGAGHAGTELAAAVEELTRGILVRHYPTIRANEVRLVLVGSAVLPQTAPDLAAYTKARLVARGIELETGRAARVSPEGLTLADGRLLESRCVIWTAGNRVSPVVAALDLPKSKDGRLIVNERFEVEGASDIYALGEQRRPDRSPHGAALSRHCAGSAAPGSGAGAADRGAADRPARSTLRVPGCWARWCPCPAAPRWRTCAGSSFTASPHGSCGRRSIC
jgi:NADH dehydrogenase